MKKYFSLLIAALMLAVLLCGCGSNMMNSSNGASVPVPTADTVIPTHDAQVGSTADDIIGNAAKDMPMPGANVSASPAPTHSVK